MSVVFATIALELGLGSAWTSEVADWGKRVDLYRKYYDGDHRANLSARMAKMLRITEQKEFNINYCLPIIQTMANRLTVARIDAEDSDGWIDRLLAWSNFESLQMDIYEAAIRDGDTFLMVAFDNENDMPILAHELAWNGSTGIIPIYNPSNTEIIAAIKVWYEVRTVEKDGGVTNEPKQRVNVYYPDMVKKYWLDSWELISEDKWLVGYVPIVHFKNNARPLVQRGKSEIDNVLGLQDTLNRTLTSLTMVAELGAFPINVIIGAESPTEVEPGMFLSLTEKDAAGNSIGVSKDKQVGVTQLQAAGLVPYISQAEFIIKQMGEISSTPLQKSTSDTASGESRKQQEVGLLAKVKKAQVRFGESWVWAMELAVSVARVYAKSNKAPVAMGVPMVQWVGAEIRNDAELITNAMKVADRVSEKEFYRMIAPVYGWDDARIEQIIAEKAGEKSAFLAGLNPFGNNGMVNNTQ